MTFKNQVVWITGASSGIGRQLSLEFARQGAIVAASARRMDMLNQLVAEIEAGGGESRAFYCDVLDPESINLCVSNVIAHYSKLDVAVANAGYGVVGKIETLTDSDWNRQLAVNVTGLALTTRYAIPYLRQTKGRLCLLGSVAAFIPNPQAGAYGASKAAVHSIGETLQVELRGSGVSCTTVHPGFVESNITRIDNQGGYHPELDDPRPAHLIWPAEKAARAIVNAIARRKKVYVFTAHGRLAVFLSRHFPDLSRKMMAKAIA
jgi:NAD(P)-dependent dehydrogenase (short-subunit alcohol dehydrogenase family)